MRLNLISENGMVLEGDQPMMKDIDLIVSRRVNTNT